MITIRNKTIPFGRYKAMLLFGLLFVKGNMTDIDMNHEAIHDIQCREMLYVGFYLWYLIEWVVRLLIYRNWSAAYRNISFEREAYSNERNLNYTNERELFNFINYI